MKVRMPRERLITLLATVLPAAGRQAGTILSHVHLTIDDLGRLLATCSSYELALQAWAECDDCEDGAMVLPAATLAKFLAALPAGGVVQITKTAAARAVIECGQVRAEISGLAIDEWPSHVVADEYGALFEVPREVLAIGVRTTLPFVSDQAERPALCAICLDIAADGVTFAATDGTRLSKFASSTPAPAARPGRYLVPSVMAREVLDNLKRYPNARAFLATDGRHVTAQIGPALVQGRAEDSPFPDYTRVIPKQEHDYTASVEIARLVESASRCAIICDTGKDGLRKVRITMQGKSITVSAYGLTGEVRDAFDLGSLFGGGRGFRTVTAAVDPVKLREALATFAGASAVEVQLTESKDPMLFASPEVPGLIHVLMPML